MQRHTSDKTRQRSRALVPVSRSLQPASVRLRGVELEGAVPPQAPRRRVWGLGLKIFGGVAAVCAVALAGANLLAPTGWVETRAVSWLKAHTGRDLAINGGTRLSFLPTPHIEITDAVISAPNAQPDAAALAIPKLEIDLGFLISLGPPTRSSASCSTGRCFPCMWVAARTTPRRSCRPSGRRMALLLRKSSP
ncbi:hypothetical protein AUC70_01080 [Methyloceanibacter stevinii]|uniref:AsmA domain-containing protein n=1 Tax=Methyloceanibacter stevinii TaxID=1774970 RepID=A0A1E3VPU1_9HYPH|nr:hypothetical protein [Methyloceanibacter stevinii]ODR95545.1 hypothetical protein AUC70_01080 [Methyloceanibacter stevinii]